MASSLRIRGVQKRFNNTSVLKGIDLEIGAGEFLVLVGPSGCGKSTLLNLIAGIDTPTEGEIWIGDRMVNAVPPRDRDIAMVFQSYALYPTMTVRQNITFGLEMRKVPKPEREQALERVADLLQITHLLDRKPAELSGGQRQRVAMGRALVRDPKLFLFDEPLSNLDAKLRVDMRTEIKKLHHRLGTTIVYVTHDQVEAMTLATRIAVMNQGVIQQFADPRTIYEQPRNLFVAGFMGSPAMNFIKGQLVQAGNTLAVRVGENGGAIDFPLLETPTTAMHYINRDVILGIRPETISAVGSNDHSAAFTFDAPVIVVEPTGPDTMVLLNLGGSEIIARVHPDDHPVAGQPLRFTADMAKASLFDPQTGERIQ